MQKEGTPKMASSPYLQMGQSVHVSNLRTVLLGHDMKEKSSAGNTILGIKMFDTENNTIERCNTMEKRQGAVAGRQVTVINTPMGMSWFLAQDPLSVNKLIQDIGSLCPPGPNAFLIVFPIETLRGREWTAQATLQLLPERVWRHTVVLFTKGEELRGTAIEQLIEREWCLRQIVEKCGNRYHVLNTTDRADGTQVTELLQKIEEMVAGNSGDYFLPDEALQELEEKMSALKIRGKKRPMKVQKERETPPMGESYRLSGEIRVMHKRQKLTWMKTGRANEQIKREIEELKERCEKTEREIEELKESCEEKEREIEELKNSCEAEKSEIEELKENCEEKEREIEELKENCEEKEREIEELKNSCEEEERETEQLKDSCEEKEREIEELKNSCEEKETETEELKNSCEEEEREIEELKDSCEEKEREIEELKNSCEEEKRDIEKLKNSYDEKEREIEELKESCDEKEREIEVLKDSCEEKEIEIEELKEKCEDRLREIEELIERCEEREREIEEPKEKCEELEREIEEPKEKCEELEREIEELKEKCEELEREIEELKEECEETFDF